MVASGMPTVARLLDVQHMSLIRSIIDVINHFATEQYWFCKAVKLADGTISNF